MISISVVIPVYQSEESLRELCSRLDSAISSLSLNYEVILVNDSSPDNSWHIIKNLAESDERIRGINLSRNFGQHYAITAGLEYVRGDWVVVMDCDLQDLPEEIPKLYQKALDGYDMVVGRKTQRQDSFLKRMGSRCFYRAYTYFTGAKVDNRIGNFGIYARKVINSILTLREQNRSFGMFALWVGFRRAEIDVEHSKRPYGKTSYTIRRLLLLAMDSIVAHSNKLLRISVKIGFVLSSCSLLYAFWLIIRYFFWLTPVEGWTSLMVSVFFTAGLIVGNIGVVGLYVGKIFDEVKGRPLYIIDSTTFNVKSNEK